MRIKTLLIIIAIMGSVIAGSLFYWQYTQNEEELWQKASVVTEANGAKVVRGPAKKPFKHPTGITVEGDYIYVVDSDNHKIRVFDRNWEQVLEFGGYGQKSGQLGYPMAVGFTNNQEMLISEVSNARVQVFSKEGKPLRMFAAARGLLPGPTLMTIAAGERIYIYDKGSMLIKVFSLEGKLLNTIGVDQKIGRVRYVMGMDVDQEGNLLVSDSGHHEVRIYSAEGKLQDRLLGGYNGVPKLELPRGIAVIAKDKFALVDAMQRKVFILQKRDDQWSSQELKYSFVLPDSADYRDGKLYITDRADNSIVVFENLK